MQTVVSRSGTSVFLGGCPAQSMEYSPPGTSNLERLKLALIVAKEHKLGA